MATLGKIRSWGWVLILIVGLAMLAFILGDLFTSTSSFANRNAQILAEIEGEEITIQEFSAAIDQYTEMIKSNYNLDNLTEEQQLQIRQQVWDNLVAEHLMKSEAAEMGISVTEKEVVARTTGENLHPIIARMFPNKEGLSNFLNYINTDEVPEDLEQAAQLQRNKNYWLYQVNAVRQSLLQEKYINLISAATMTNSLEVKADYDASANTSVVEYVSKPYYMVADSLVTVSDKEVKALYNKRRESFKQQPNRSICYVSFPIVPSAEDYQNIAERMNSLREEFTTAEDIVALVNTSSDIPYTGRNYSKDNVPEQYKDFAFAGKKGDFTEIMFADNTYSMARIMETGYSLPDTVTLEVISLSEKNNARVDSIKKAVKTGASWSSLVAQYNPDAENEGEFGVFAEDQLASSLAQMHFPGARHIVDSAFTVGKNGTFAMQVGRGTYIFHVKDQTVATPKVKLAVLSMTVTPSRITMNDLYNQARSFVIDNNSSEKFAAAAAEQNLSLRRASNLTENENNVNNLKSARQIVKWAYDAEVGEVSDVFECGDEFVVAALEDVDKSEYASLESKNYELRAELVRNAKAANLIDQLDQVSSLQQAGEILGDTIHVAENVNFGGMLFGNMIEPAVLGAVSVLPVGQVSQPIQGQNGVYVVRVQATETTEDELNVDDAKAQANSRIQQTILNEVWNNVRENADIEDNRANFY